MILVSYADLLIHQIWIVGEMRQLCFIVVSLTQHYWHLGRDKFLLGSSILCIVTCLAASLASAFFMYSFASPTPTAKLYQPKISSDILSLWGQSPPAENHLSQVFNPDGNPQMEWSWWGTGMYSVYSQEFHFRHVKY